MIKLSRSERCVNDQRHETLAPESLVDILPLEILEIWTVRSYLLPHHYRGTGTEQTTILIVELYLLYLGDQIVEIKMRINNFLNILLFTYFQYIILFQKSFCLIALITVCNL